MDRNRWFGVLGRNNWYLPFSRETSSVNHLPDNETELLPGLLPFVPKTPMLLTDCITCELGLSNGTRGIFREFVYDDQENPAVFKVKSELFPSNTIYVRKPLYALVEMISSPLILMTVM
jgi:hypothetical protein